MSRNGTRLLTWPFLLTETTYIPLRVELGIKVMELGRQCNCVVRTLINFDKSLYWKALIFFRNIP